MWGSGIPAINSDRRQQSGASVMAENREDVATAEVCMSVGLSMGFFLDVVSEWLIRKT